MLLTVLLACTCNRPTPPATPPEPIVRTPYALTEAAVPGFPDFRASHAHQLQLDRLPATWTLPDVQLPESVASMTDEFVLEAEEMPNPRGVKRNMKVLRAPLPFPVDTDEQTFKPEGMLVSIDGKPISFAKGPAPNAKKSTWRITGKFMVLSHPTVPAPGTLKVRYAGVRDALDRHDPARATDGDTALDPAGFTRYASTLAGHTRHGLLLVAPTRASWKVTLPAGAKFQTWLSLEAPPLDQPVSDGAVVSLAVTAQGKRTVVAEQKLAGASIAFQEWSVDLAPWAGQEVELELASSPGRTATFDWVFAGSPTVTGEPDGDVRRVVVVALDTTRPDHFSMNGYTRQTTPEIDRWAGGGVVFDRAWSTAPRTRPSFRSSTTGRLPLEAVGATNIAEVFAQQGFATGGFVANVHLQPRFAFDVGYDSWWFDGQANAATQVDRALGWLDANKSSDSYLFLHIMDPHMAYDAPAPYRDQFVTEVDPTLPPHPKREQVISMMHKGTLQDVGKRQLTAMHDGELAFTSVQLGRLFDAIDAMPGRTLVVLHSDHGEEFWEHDGFEHNHSLFDELTRTVFVLRPGGGLPEGRRMTEPVSLMDLAPTLYDLFGFPEIPAVDGRTLVPLLAGGGWSELPLPVGYLQYSHERWGVVWRGHKYILHTGSGREELYDLTADPGEKHDIAADVDLTEYRLRLRESHDDLPVGPGFRIRVELAADGPPLVLELPSAPRSADVLDPEAIVENRANVEWGESPKKLPSQVGAVTTTGATLTFQPGPQPQGVLYALFDAPPDLSAVKATLGGTPIALAEEPEGRAWKDGAFSVVVEPGIVVVPPESEAHRMGIGAEGEMDELCKLGYVQGELCERNAPNEIAPPDDEGEPEGEELRE
ncbi:MAG: sulfatase [Myxococcota bacterium]